MAEGGSPKLDQFDNDPSVRQVTANGICMRTNVVEAKLDEGNIQDAEFVLRDKLSLSFEVRFINALAAFPALISYFVPIFVMLFLNVGN